MERAQQQGRQVITKRDGRKGKPTRHFFHQGHRLVACIGEGESHRVIRAGIGALGQLSDGPAGRFTGHYMIDRPSSVLGMKCSVQKYPINYTAYGYSHVFQAFNLIGFNGVYQEESTGQYALGAGNRFYSSTLMRFSSPDNFSPFAAGGINAYAYCAGDPVNSIDPSGNAPVPILSKAKHPSLHQFLASDQGKDYRLFGRIERGGAKGIQRFRLKINDGAEEHRFEPYKKPTLPMYMSEDGKTSFTVAMFNNVDGQVKSLLDFDQEFRSAGYTLQKSRTFPVLDLRGETPIDQSREIFSPISFDEAGRVMADLSRHPQSAARSSQREDIGNQLARIRSGEASSRR